jgi:hypothetical protein
VRPPSRAALLCVITLGVGPTAVVAAPASDREVRRSVEEILSHREYRRLRERAKPKEPLKDCESDRESKSKPPPAPKAPSGCQLAFGGALRGLFYLLAFGAVAFALGLLLWALLRRRRDGDDKDGDEAGADEEAVMPDRAPGEEAAATYLERALQLAAKGDLRAALRQLLLGAMSHCERAGLIAFRRGLTNRDYLRVLLGQTAAFEGLQTIVEEFEIVYFGLREATTARFQRSLQGFHRGFTEDASTGTSPAA